MELIPLINSKNVIKALENNEIDLGVLATNNNYAGVVEETKKAIEESNFEFEELDSIKVDIHHCIFKKNEKIKDENIKFVASHIQALLQTTKFRQKHLENLREIETEDTAFAASNLAKGKLTDNTCVICRKNAGEKYNLELMYENIEDLKDNKTEFKIYKVKLKK